MIYYFINCVEIEFCYDGLGFFGNYKEIVDDVFGFVGEFFVKLRVLGCDFDGVGI